MEFVHLHLHTEHSLHHGAILVQELFPRLVELGMRAVAMTDLGSMAGVVEFYEAARQSGIKPIIGMEVVVDEALGEEPLPTRHLVLLARNREGYSNLCHLCAVARGCRIDQGQLAENSTGLIGLSGCHRGAISQAILAHDVERAQATAREYQRLFEGGAFYLELQPATTLEQQRLNQGLRDLGHALDIPLVATANCHCLRATDAHLHEILVALQAQRGRVNQSCVPPDGAAPRHVCSAEEMAAFFPDLPEALANTIKIADQCNVDLELGQHHLPQYEVPAGHDPRSYLAQIAHEGLEQRLAEARSAGGGVDEGRYLERLDHEVAVIERMGFAAYFLVVWDYVRWAKDKGIPVGPGRGASTGSLCAFALGITEVDPVRHRLLFERFMNEEFPMFPDFDIDFSVEGRYEVIEYLVARYGNDHVAKIATTHRPSAYRTLVDVARVMRLELRTIQPLAGRVLDLDDGGGTKREAEAVRSDEELTRLGAGDPEVRRLLNTTRDLLRLKDHYEVHAAGVVIADRPLWETVPCVRMGSGMLTSQLGWHELERVGLRKFDFLGLRSLTTIDMKVRAINAARAARQERPLRLQDIPLEDAEVCRMLSDGDTLGVFQLESDGIRDLLMRLQPDSFEHVIAATALFRPGPLERGLVDEYVERRHGLRRADHLHEVLDVLPQVEATYGLIIYQEQIDEIVAGVTGWSLGRADVLRRAMHKHAEGELQDEKQSFIGAAQERGLDATTAAETFDLLGKAAPLAFPRAHAVGYGLVTWWMAYLKCYYAEAVADGIRYET